MRRETFSVVEHVLQDFPRIVDSMMSREAYLESIVHSSFNTDLTIRGGDAAGISLSMPERVLEKKLKDVEYQELLGIVESLSDAFSCLPPVYYNVFSLFYFDSCLDIEIADSLNCSESWIKRIRHRVIRRLSSVCLRVLYFVERWRKRERKRLNKAIRN